MPAVISVDFSGNVDSFVKQHLRYEAKVGKINGKYLLYASPNSIQGTIKVVLVKKIRSKAQTQLTLG